MKNHRPYRPDRSNLGLNPDACRSILVSHEGNYIMARVPINDTQMYRLLMRRGMMVRSMTGFRFPGWIRVTLREPEAMARFAQALTDEIRALR